MKKVTLNVALGGILAALSIVLMLLTNFLPFGTYCFPCFAGILLISAVIESGYSLAISIYIVVSILSFLIVSDKEAFLYYALFLGFYPIIKNVFERINNRFFQYVLKIVCFNVCIVAAFYLGIFLFSIPKDSFTLFGVYMPLVFLLIGNIFFVVYDICITKLIYVYIIKLHPLINKK